MAENAVDKNALGRRLINLCNLKIRRRIEKQEGTQELPCYDQNLQQR